MLRPGLVSVTFRQLAVERIVALAVEARLEGIEWGGDVHVPHGDLAAARNARRMTRDAGLEVAAYGSYYRAGEADSPPFEAVLASAVELGAPTVRVWAGQKASAAADVGYRSGVVEDLQRIAGMGAGAGVEIALEFHKGTLTDTPGSTVEFLEAVGRANVSTYWQPPEGMGVAECLAGLGVLVSKISNVHVFQWTVEEGRTVAHALAEGAGAWRSYFGKFANLNAGQHWVMLEFVRDDDYLQFLEDAKTLHEILARPI